MTVITTLRSSHGQIMLEQPVQKFKLHTYIPEHACDKHPNEYDVYWQPDFNQSPR